MAPYLAAVRNYWALLPAIAIVIGLTLLYAIPTLINPQWTSSVLALFRQVPEQPDPAVDPAQDPALQPAEARRAAGILGPQQIKSRRMLAVLLVVGVVALIGFNISLNRERNGCYKAAEAWGAIPGKADRDPCINKIFGSFFGDPTGFKPLEAKPQPIETYQLIHKKHPKYLKWMQNGPSYDDVDLLIGSGSNCSLDLKVVEEDDKVMVLLDSDTPCPPEDAISLSSVKLKKPLGDRKVVTVDDKPMREINPDADSWPTVLKKLVTGG
ncbi:hypothetical protein E0H75_32555 [Kribbella capetownensis]|uniref:Uncharacterized protein n=1 Tax=Kribbella capetownensis TaxID=1572659 RepID=A0A4R0JGK6_9ACTN|nr:hypothetical protein E0H75_32555 [Kribbella capetownensis]